MRETCNWQTAKTAGLRVKVMKNQYSRTITQLCISLFYHGKQPQFTKHTSNLQNPSSYPRSFLFSAIRKQLLVRPSAFPSLALVSKRSLAWWCSGDCQLPSEGSAFWGLWRREKLPISRSLLMKCNKRSRENETSRNLDISANMAFPPECLLHSRSLWEFPKHLYATHGSPSRSASRF